MITSLLAFALPEIFGISAGQTQSERPPSGERKSGALSRFNRAHPTGLLVRKAVAY